MQMPKPLLIKMTAEQIALLAEHYAYVEHESAQGAPGMLVAQVGASQHGGHEYLRVGFISHEVAKTIVNAAK
jgi:hypothetical protein